ncbi:DUF6286 domain-containing protein [Streptomyces sp. WMMC500]|uniref:DUF6286 domain-containing protein n=1 Tax=Streptomyces sp. WMMC500 TaxID=3015154 RepID=UPI00248B1C66|nr:DUF6286 domain-containing protein [Streptomyces sp. WMMC500]WBB60118.1 DUF6286 domain-containing protein [Streptomyces sp. WMMC500]
MSGDRTTSRPPGGTAGAATAEPDEWRQRTSASGYAGEPADGGIAGAAAARFWSVRRVPAALTAAAATAGIGLLLYDVVAVRAERPAMRWRRSVADELAARPLDDPWVLAAAGLAVLLGAWLVLLAVTPGLRGVLPMRHASPDLRAGLDRRAASVVLRDRAMQISGVRSVRVTVGRRRVSARAESHFRELDDVRADLAAVLGEGIRELGLARRPELSVHVRRPPAKG